MRSKAFAVALAAVGIFSSAGAASAAGKIYYGSRAGMHVTVVSMSGLDTAKALIRTKHTRDDATAYCREYVGKVTARCVADALREVRLNDQIEANCTTGRFTDFSGAVYQYVGELKNKPDDVTARFGIRDVARAELLDGSGASGYGTMLGIFRALCPRTAPQGDDY